MKATAHKYWANPRSAGAAEWRFGKDPTKPWTDPSWALLGISRVTVLDIDGVPHIYVSTYQDPQQASERGVCVRLWPATPGSNHRFAMKSRGIDPGLPVFNVRSMNDVLDRSLASRRFFLPI